MSYVESLTLNAETQPALELTPSLNLKPAPETLDAATTLTLKTNNADTRDAGQNARLLPLPTAHVLRRHLEPDTLNAETWPAPGLKPSLNLKR